MLHRHTSAWPAGLMPCTVCSVSTCQRIQAWHWLDADQITYACPSQGWLCGQGLHGLHSPFFACPHLGLALPCRCKLGQELQGLHSALTWCAQHVVALRCRSGASDNSYMAFRAADRVVGLMSWPLDGDPAKSVGVIAHPGPVLTAALTHDGRKLLSAGVQDGVVNVWQVGGMLGSIATVPHEKQRSPL